MRKIKAIFKWNKLEIRKYHLKFKANVLKGVTRLGSSVNATLRPITSARCVAVGNLKPAWRGNEFVRCYITCRSWIHYRSRSLSFKYLVFFLYSLRCFYENFQNRFMLFTLSWLLETPDVIIFLCTLI